MANGQLLRMYSEIPSRISELGVTDGRLFACCPAGQQYTYSSWSDDCRDVCPRVGVATGTHGGKHKEEVLYTGALRMLKGNRAIQMATKQAEQHKVSAATACGASRVTHHTTKFAMATARGCYIDHRHQQQQWGSRHATGTVGRESGQAGSGKARATP